jgi:hypothetical protein
MSNRKAVRLYTLKEETLYIDQDCQYVQFHKVLHDEAGGPPLFFADPHPEKLPIYLVARCVRKPAARPFNAEPPMTVERHYFAVEPALRQILEEPFREELRAAKRERDQEAKEKREAKTELEEKMCLIELFKSAPLYRRLWIALRPGHFWRELKRLGICKP